MLEINYVNSVPVVAKNPKMTAINSAIEVGKKILFHHFQINLSVPFNELNIGISGFPEILN